MENLRLEPTELSPNRPHLTFEKGSYTLAEVIRNYPIPVVVQADCGYQPAALNQFNFDLSQPLLLYRRRNIQKVPARSLAVHAGKYTEVGEQLLIPEDYKGWFAVLQRWMGNSKVEDTAPHFASVEELANSNTERFLIGGTDQINGMHVLDRSEAHLNHQQRQFLPGDILTRVKIYYGETKKKTRLFRKPKYITAKFLMCYDESDREILLPFEQKGIFYQISERSGKPNRNVMQMSDVVARNLTPRILKHIFGRVPVTPSSFNGLLKAESVTLEYSVIAATIQNVKNILLEIPILDAISFRVAVMNDDLRQNACYRDAINICSEKVTTYMRNIKVCYNFADSDTVDVNENSTPVLRKRPVKDSAMNSQEFLNMLPFSDLLNTQNKLQASKSVGLSNASLSPLNKRYDKFHRPRSYGLKSYYKLTTQHVVGSGTKPQDQKQGTSHSPKINREATLKQTRLSEDVATSPIIRPLRSMSVSRMSLCLGNSYLTVPIYATDLLPTKESNDEAEEHRNSMDNLSVDQRTENKRRLSTISFDGRFFNEDVGTEDKNEAINENDPCEIVPPPMPRTNIDSYLNVQEPTRQPPSIEVTGPADIVMRRPSHTPPNTTIPYSNGMFKATHISPDTNLTQSTAPSTNNKSGITDKVYCKNNSLANPNNLDPTKCKDSTDVVTQRLPSVNGRDTVPLPVPSYRDSRTSSGVSSSSMSPTSSTCEEALLRRNSTDLVEYDVPKIQERNATIGVLSDSRDHHNGANLGVHQESCDGGDREILSVLHEPHGGDDGGVLVPASRPSTLTFIEGCDKQQKPQNIPTFQTIEDTEDKMHATADEGKYGDDPIYENLKALMDFLSNSQCDTDEIDTSEDGTSSNHTALEFGSAPQREDEEISTSEVVVVQNNAQTSESRNQALNDSVTEFQFKDASRSTADMNNAHINAHSGKYEGPGDNIAPTITKHSEDIKDSFSYLKCDDMSINIDREITEFNNSVQEIGFEVPKKSMPPAKPAKPTRVSSLKKQTTVATRAPPLSREQNRSESFEYNRQVIRSKSDSIIQGIQSSIHFKPVLRSCSETADKDIHTNQVKGIIRSPSQERAMIDMNVEQLSEKLKELGINDKTVKMIEDNQIDGHIVSLVLNGEVELQDCLKGIRLVDQQKIAMLIRGWRPNE